MDSPDAFDICAACGKAGTGFSRCGRCRAASYCHRECQKVDWKRQHKRLCQQLNVSSEGQAQVYHPDHDNFEERQVVFLRIVADSPPNVQAFFKTFFTQPDTPATVLKMKKLIRKEPMWYKQMIMYQAMHVLIDIPKSEMLLRNTSPLLVCLHGLGCDPNYLSRPAPPYPRDNRGSTALHKLAEMASAENIQTHHNQVIMGRQLLLAGAAVNATAEEGLSRVTPLHRACHSQNVTNLQFIRLLLTNGANPNAQTSLEGETPLMHTMQMAMSAAKLLLTFPYDRVLGAVPINPNVTTHNGSTFLGSLRFSRKMLPVTAAQVPRASLDFMRQQMTELEQILLEHYAAVDGGWRPFNYMAVEEEQQQQRPSHRSNPTTLSFNVTTLLDKDR